MVRAATCEALNPSILYIPAMDNVEHTGRFCQRDPQALNCEQACVNFFAPPFAPPFASAIQAWSQVD